MLDLHRHDEGSLFDGFGKPKEIVKIAQKLGYTSLGISNHGNMITAVKHWKACTDAGIKPILGIEGYFLPQYKEKHRGYHLCLFAKNNQGYTNLNTIQYEGEKLKYYNSIWTTELLQKYSDGLICTTACAGSFFGAMIHSDRGELAERLLIRLKEIFAGDLYVEIQPYSITEGGMQEKINREMMKLAKKHKVKCILTSDSHFGSRDDFDTYLKMHEIADHDLNDITATYSERYMPTRKELLNRFLKMHGEDLGVMRCKELALEMMENLQEIEDKVDADILGKLEIKLPQFNPDIPSDQLLLSNTKKGMKWRGITEKKYVDRAKEELDVIHHHGFEDYFLMVQDYIKWAKDRNIAVGAGRGSCCNYIVNYALGITEVDSLYFELEPKRFIMKERNKMPDIDIDFESGRRKEVIHYLLKKYQGHSAQICSYGLYQVDNLVNDLGKVCGLPTTLSEIKANPKYQTRESPEGTRKWHMERLAEIKKYIRTHIDDAELDKEGLMADEDYEFYNKQHDNIMKHFVKLFNKIRFIGTHAAGVAITGGNIFEYTSLRIDPKTGATYTMYDLTDIEIINVIKFDMLGLSTMSEIGECRKMTGIPDFQQDMIFDKDVLEGFRLGKCNGVFQLDRHAVQGLLRDINANTFNDVVAATAMNRPGPLQQGMPKIYAANKELAEQGQDYEASVFSKWLGKTYGTIIYQEQIMQMAVDIASMTWDEAHFITKAKFGYARWNWYFDDPNLYQRFMRQFLEGCERLKLNIAEEDAKVIFHKFYHYSFNEGHSVGYTLLSVEQMYYKVHYPNIFWYTKLKYTSDENRIYRYMIECVGDGGLVFLPHVNFNAEYSLRKFDGEYIVQQGYNTIKNVGAKAAQFIQEERDRSGRFRDYDDFVERCKSRAVTSRVIESLKEAGALEFEKDEYMRRVKEYNITLYQKFCNRR